MLVLSHLVSYDGNAEMHISRLVGVASALGVAGLAYVAVAAAGRRSAGLLAAASLTVVTLGVVAAVGVALTYVPDFLLLELTGYALVAAGVSVAQWRVAGPVPETPRPVPTAAGWWHSPWIAAAGMAGCAVLLVVLQRNYLAQGGFAVFIALPAAAVLWRRGTVGNVALGIATGVGLYMIMTSLLLIGSNLVMSMGQSTPAWATTALVSGVMVAFGLAESARRGTLTLRRPDPFSVGLIVIGVAALTA